MRQKIKTHRKKQNKKYRIGFRNEFPSLFEVYGLKKNKPKKKKKNFEQIDKKI